MSTITTRLRPRLAVVAACSAVVLAAGACVPPPSGGGGGGGSSTTASTTTVSTTTVPATWSPGACPGSAGVTVVVDFAGLGPAPIVRCALGSQSNGMAALSNAGFAVSSEAGPGTVCRLDGQPAEGFPFCWLTGGYWSYWRASNPGAPWAFSETGAGVGPLVPGSVEGWAWAPGFVSDGPSVPSSG